MKTIKVIWSLVLLFAVASCSTEENGINEQQNVKDELEKVKSLEGSWIIPNDFDYGMPIADFWASGGMTIKIAYRTNDFYNTMVSIRKEFSAKNPNLYIAKVVAYGEYSEEWVLKYGLSIGDAQNHPEEDEDLIGEDQFYGLLRDIRNHPLVELYDEIPVIDPNLGLGTAGQNNKK